MVFESEGIVVYKLVFVCILSPQLWYDLCTGGIWCL